MVKMVNVIMWFTYGTVNIGANSSVQEALAFSPLLFVLPGVQITFNNAIYQTLKTSNYFFADFVFRPASSSFCSLDWVWNFVQHEIAALGQIEAFLSWICSIVVVHLSLSLKSKT